MDEPVKTKRGNTLYFVAYVDDFKMPRLGFGEGNNADEAIEHFHTLECKLNNNPQKVLLITPATVIGKAKIYAQVIRFMKNKLQELIRNNTEGLNNG